MDGVLLDHEGVRQPLAVSLVSFLSLNERFIPEVAERPQPILHVVFPEISSGTPETYPPTAGTMPRLPGIYQFKFISLAYEQAYI